MLLSDSLHDLRDETVMVDLARFKPVRVPATVQRTPVRSGGTDHDETRRKHVLCAWSIVSERQLETAAPDSRWRECGVAQEISSRGPGRGLPQRLPDLSPAVGG